MELILPEKDHFKYKNLESHTLVSDMINVCENYPWLSKDELLKKIDELIVKIKEGW